jgi:DNA-binding NtrC family response regulator
MTPKKGTKPATTILVVDDEKSMRESLQMLLKENYQVLLAKSGREALDQIKKQPVDLVLLDIRLPEIDGLETLKQIKSFDETIEVIMVTAVIMVKKAVEAIRLGAYDYITKPFDIDTLQAQIEKVLEKRQLRQQNLSLKQLIDEEFQFEKIIGKSQPIREIFNTINDVSHSPATVLITGESGTGKELVARAIHNRSPRKDKLFVAVNCAAIPENLLESELFGHERGSFTSAHERQLGKFEIANGGTLFLDEIGSLPLAMQAKLLRAIQQKEIERIGAGYPLPIDVRIIAATNSDLRAAIQKNKFREDLFYRLNVIPVQLPSLRDRKEDIPLLAHHFLEKLNREFGKNIHNVKPETMALLMNYNWPGNVRELENLIERLMVLTKANTLGSEHLPPEIVGGPILKIKNEENTFTRAVQQFEADFIRQAIAQSGGKKSKAAKILGIHRNTLINLEKKLGLND